MSSLTADDFDVKLDFSEIREAGEFKVNVIINAKNEKSSKFLVKGDTIQKTVNVIQIEEKSFKVTPYTEGIELAEGRSIEDSSPITVSPDMIKISGEKSLIDSVASVRAVAKSDTPIFETTVLSGELVFINTHGERIITDDITTEERAFSVTIPVYRRKTLKLNATVINIPDNFDSAFLKERMRIEPAELIVAVPYDSTETLTEWTLPTTKSLSDIVMNSEFSIPIELSEEYINVSGERNAKVIFDIYEGEYQVKTFDVPRDNFSVINLSSDFDVEYVTRNLSVQVIGPVDVIDAMAAADINGVVNFGGITDISEGQRSVGIRFSVAGTNVRAWIVGDYKVDVKVNRK